MIGPYIDYFIELLVTMTQMFQRMASFVQTSVLLLLQQANNPLNRSSSDALKRTLSTSLYSTRSIASASSRGGKEESKLDALLQHLNLSSTVQEIHLIILIHGWLGNPMEMGYIQESLENQIHDYYSTNNSTNNDKETTKFIIHSAISNDKQTTDGIEKGGTRIANEINYIVQQVRQQIVKAKDVTKKTQQQPVITLSIIGNSLGGLYGRYALSKITDLPKSKDTTAAITNNNTTVRIQPKLFVTTATPHLGKSGLSYIRVPRVLELFIGKVLLSTGEDLFNCNPLIEQMCTQDTFLQPLQQFQKRIAYANSYGTDFQVPTNTAAFLSDTNSRHKIIDDNPKSSSSSKSSSMIRLTVQTLTEEEEKREYGSVLESNTNKLQQQQSNSDAMALRLDKLGWIKIFCDVRTNLLPPIPVPPPFIKKENGDDDKEKNSNNSNKKDYYTSSELQKMFGNDRIYKNKWHIPTAHTVLIANSKSEFYSKLNEGGRPLVDKMTSDIIQDILNL